MANNNKFQSKNMIILKKINNVICEMMVKTVSDMVYTDPETTLTETLHKIYNLLEDHTISVKELEKRYKKIVHNAPECFNTFKEVWNYVNVDNPRSKLIQMINSKQSAEEGKGLSTNDFTDGLKMKLENLYTKEQLDQKFEEIIIESGVQRALEELQAQINEVNENLGQVDERVDVLEQDDEEDDNRIIVDIEEGFDMEKMPNVITWFNVQSKDEEI